MNEDVKAHKHSDWDVYDEVDDLVRCTYPGCGAVRPKEKDVK